MEKVDNYKKILEILWDKYFRATFNFVNSQRNLSNAKKFRFINGYLRLKYNPKRHKTQNVNWIMIQNSFGQIDKKIIDMLLNQYIEAGRKIFSKEWQEYQRQRSTLTIFVRNYKLPNGLLFQQKKFLSKALDQMDNSLFEHDMLFVAKSQITYQNLKKKIRKERQEMPKEVKTLQIGFGKYKKFIEIVVPVRFKIPNFTQLDQLAKVYLKLVK